MRRADKTLVLLLGIATALSVASFLGCQGTTGDTTPTAGTTGAGASSNATTSSGASSNGTTSSGVTSSSASGGGAAASAGSSGTGGSAATTGAGGSMGAGGGGGADSTPKPTFYVQGRMLKDPCGQDFVARGYNHMMVYADQSCAACTEIAKTGANAVRMMWVSEVPLSNAEKAVETAVAAGMLPILENQDTTCDTGQALTDAVNFWTSADSVTFIQKHQQHLLINIANEPGTMDDATYKTFCTSAVSALRQAGIHTPLVLDAAGCGRDGEQALSLGPAILAADPDHNLIFSWHMYDSGDDQPARITMNLQTSVDENLPFLMGEFGPVGDPFCTAVPYQTVITQAQAQNIGYMPWSWTPGNSDCKSGSSSPFDMTSKSTFATLQPGWATEVSLTDPSSIQKTSTRSQFLVKGTCQ